MVRTMQTARHLKYVPSTAVTNPRRHLSAGRSSATAQPLHRYPTRIKRGRKGKKKPFDKPFRFLDLPAELRNRIYDYVLTEEPYGGRRMGVWRITEDGDLFAILQTCHEIYNEARDIPFYLNFVSFEHISEPSPFLGRASDYQISLITKLELPIDFEDRGNLTDWGMVKLFRNLTTLRLYDREHDGHRFLGEPDHPVAIKIKALRGLADLQVMTEEDEDKETDVEVLRMNQLAAAWKPIVTQPKPLDDVVMSG